MITGARAVIPDTGFPADGRRFDVALTNGETVPADLVIQATGQKPNSEILASLPQSSPSESHINSTNKFIRVKPTLQLADPKYPNIFALGDVADTGAQKSVKAAVPQMETVFSNIQSLIQGQEAKATFTPVRPGIHLSLGKSRHAVFRNDPINPDREPTVIHHYEYVDITFPVEGPLPDFLDTTLASILLTSSTAERKTWESAYCGKNWAGQQAMLRRRRRPQANDFLGIFEQIIVGKPCDSMYMAFGQDESWYLRNTYN